MPFRQHSIADTQTMGTQPRGQPQQIAGDASATKGPPQSRDLEQVPLKRRRIALACNACRIRKSRCNGGQPKCSLCEQMGFGCNYETSDATANVVVSKWSMSAFEERLNGLEERVKMHDELLQRDDVLRLPSNGTSNSIKPAVRLANEIEFQDEPLEDKLTDGMAITFASEDDSGFFGCSSNISFMRHIAHAMDAAGREQSRSPNVGLDSYHFDSGIISVSRPASLPDTTSPGSEGVDAGKLVHHLPSELETRDLIRRYFSNTGILFPFIHEASFLHEYDTMQSERHPKVRRTWLGLLNLILAMATATSVDHEQPSTSCHTESDVFYQRAYELCKRQMLRGASLETVQCLLLMSQYLQGTQKSMQTWAIHGLAVKAAYSLGLHSSHAATKFSPVIQEMRKRTWYGCVILDRSLSMTFGRPNAIPEDHVQLDLPTAIDGELSPIGGDSDPKAMSLDFFVASIKLYRVQFKVISTLYGQNLGCGQLLSNFDTATEVFKLEQELTSWQCGLAPPLYIRSHQTVLYESHAACAERFRIILTLRFLNLQLLLHRPFLSRSLDARANRNKVAETYSSAEHLASGSIQNCVRSAEEIISIIHCIIFAKRAHDLLGALWFSVYYVFGASLTIFGSLLIAPGLTTLNTPFPHRLKHSSACLQKAMEALRQLETGNQVATRCASYLAQLSGLLDRWQCTPESLDNSTGDMVLPRELFQPGGIGIPSFEGLEMEMSQTASGDFDTSRFGLNDLEMGQFFIPSNEFGNWCQPYKEVVPQ